MKQRLRNALTTFVLLLVVNLSFGMIPELETPLGSAENSTELNTSLFSDAQNSLRTLQLFAPTLAIELSQSAQLPVCAITGSELICAGASTQICAPIGYTSYLWSTGETTSCISVDVAGTYTVTITDGLGTSSSCSREMYSNCTPIITGIAETITVACASDVPEPVVPVVINSCTGEAVQFEVLENGGNPEEICALSTAMGLGPDWALWLPSHYSNGTSSSANFVFDANGGTFDQFANGTAHLHGTVVNDVNPSESYVLDFWFENKRDWTDWSALGRSYKDDAGFAAAGGNLWTTWNYYELVNNFSTAIGTGDLTGNTLFFQHMPDSYMFGFQVGVAANNKNANYGMSGWFTYTGIVDGVMANGYGDVNVDAECVVQLGDVCIDQLVYTYTYMAIDDCMNSATFTQTIIINDSIAPTFVNFPADLTVSCEDWPIVIPEVEAIDNCEGGVIISDFTTDIIGGDCLNSFVVTYSWTATDLCDNAATAVWTVTVIDQTAPVITTCPEDSNFACLSDVPAANVALVAATDNCGEVTISLFSEITNGDDCSGTIVRTYRAADDCGNYSDCVQIITYNDTIAPVFINAPANMTASCENVPSIEDVIATDNCGEAVVVVSVQETLFSGGCVGVIQRIFTATDACGNTATHEQYITLVDTLAPVFDNLPADISMECSDKMPLIANVTATDNCDESVIVIFSETTIDGNCPENYTILRTWTATDTCENSVSYTQVISVNDNTAPTFDVESWESDVSCDTPINFPAPIATDNCDDDVEVVLTTTTIDGDCPNEFTEINTWVATDNCGNSSSVTITINQVDNEAPVFTLVPAEISVECGDTIPVTVAEAVDNCGDVTITYSDGPLTDDDCAGYYLRTFTAVDECGNLSYAGQIINIIDVTAPVITTCASDVNYVCLSDVPAANTSLIVASDECSGVTITLFSEVTNGDDCSGTIIRTYRAADDCGNYSDCVQVITYNDTIAPVFINAPANMTASCENVPSIEDVIATDNCGTAVVVVSVQETLFSGGCVGVIQRIFTATDACGNTATHEQYITLVDTIAPVLGDLPANATYECDEPVPAPAIVTATDNCDESVIVEFSQSTNEGDCANEFTILRTWTATDTCENSVSYTQVISIVDTTAPTFNVENSTISVDCDTEYEVIAPIAFDNCDNNPTVTVISSSAPGDCANEYSEVYVWTATDNCGNSASVSLTVNYVDEIAPVFTFVPATISVECGDAIPVTTAEAVDNCGDVTITYADSPLTDDDCAGYYIRTFTATDECGNTATATQLINIVDTAAPVIVACPADVNYVCLSDVPAANAALVVATDVCSGVTITLFSEVTDGDDCSGTIVRTYRAADDCGNYSDCVQVITYNDTIAPVFINAPGNMTASCENVPSIEDVIATDNCGTAVVVVSVQETLFSGGCVGVIQRIFTATDACGNTATHEQYITLIDTLAPVLGDVPANATYECDEPVPAPAIVTATDNCDLAVSVVFSQSINEGDCANEYTILRTWTATDTCENSVSYTQVISIVDTTAPTFNVENSTISVDCGTEYVAITPVAFDNCDNNPIVTVTSSTAPGVCANEYSEVYVWTATDNCGNSASVSLTVNYVDEIAPVFTFVPAAIVVECGAAIPVTTAEAVDNCGDVTITYSDGPLTEDDCAGYYLRTFTAVDACGNIATATQIINIVDTTAPVFTQTFADVVVECAEDAPAYAIATATDNCGAVSVDMVTTTLSSDSCGNYVEMVIYFATDDCGNSATQSYTITVEDLTAPVLSDTPADLVIDCLESLPAAPAITAVDNCEGFVAVSYSEQFFGDVPTPGSISDCNLVNAPGTNPDWGLWLQDLPEGYNYYVTVSANFVEFPDGTAHLTGTVVSETNPNAGWIIDVWFMNGLEWDEWSNQSFDTGYKNDAGFAGNNYLDWTFYITNGSAATLTGTGDLAGSSFSLSHAPASLFYGFQVGIAANNFSAGYGMGGWFHYVGNFQNAAIPFYVNGVIVNGVGDFAFEGDCCPIYNVDRTWTATDCSGNTTTWTQNISFLDLPETPEIVEAPSNLTFNMNGNFIAIANVFPNPSKGAATIEFISTKDASVTLEVYNVLGNIVARLYSGNVQADVVNRVQLDGNDMHSGMFYIRMSSENESVVEKFVKQ